MDSLTLLFNKLLSYKVIDLGATYRQFILVNYLIVNVNQIFEHFYKLSVYQFTNGVRVRFGVGVGIYFSENGLKITLTSFNVWISWMSEIFYSEAISL